jgi:hypothetical protein
MAYLQRHSPDLFFGCLIFAINGSSRIFCVSATTHGVQDHKKSLTLKKIFGIFSDEVLFAWLIAVMFIILMRKTLS